MVFFISLISWGKIEAPPGFEEGWKDPYPVSLRTVELCKWMMIVLFQVLEKRMMIVFFFQERVKWMIIVFFRVREREDTFTLSAVSRVKKMCFLVYSNN